jgi:hypothetical protein
MRLIFIAGILALIFLVWLFFPRRTPDVGDPLPPPPVSPDAETIMLNMGLVYDPSTGAYISAPPALQEELFS